MSSPLARVKANIDVLRAFHRECEGCPVEELCDQAEALVAVARAAETADAVLFEHMPEWYGDREWPELDALREALSRLGNQHA